jgi:serine/threonine protein phosphatase PrpC
VLTQGNPARRAPFIPAGAATDVVLDAAGLTDIGHHRDKNEDAYLIGTLQRSMVVHEATGAAEGWLGGAPAGTLLAVADGMGGQGGGEIASRTAISAVASYLQSSLTWAPPSAAAREQRDSLNGVRDQLFSAVLASDDTVKTAGSQTATPHMGTTLTMALFLWPTVYVAHVGDSRCYLLSGGKLRRLTTDHNLAEQADSAIKYGHLPPEYLQSVLWNTLGATEELPRPDVCKQELTLGDTLLLCSDGLNKHVTDEQIQAVLTSGATSRQCCARLVQLALDHGGTDNVTVLVGHVRPAAERLG